MIENSFIHLPGIGAETEARFWTEGILTWDALSSHLPQAFGAKKAQKIAAALDECRAAFAAREFRYFQGRLKGAEIWRILPCLLSQNARIAYLDIETTGLGFPPQCRSTTVAVYYDGQLIVEHDHHRKQKLFMQIEAEAEALVTFNGGTFDLPFLRREFGLRLDQPHVDLRFWLARLGYRGGLKRIQQSLPEVRPRESMDIDGFDAVRLWRLHERGVPNALETLATYNAEDTVVLEALVHCALNREAARRPNMKLGPFTAPPPPTITTAICPLVYRMLRSY